MRGMFIISLFLIAISCYALNVQDYPSIQAAYDACPYKGELYFPVGTYTLNATLKITKPVSFRGEGTGSVIQGNGFDMIVYNPEKREGIFEWCYVKDLTLCNLSGTGNLLTLNFCGGMKLIRVGLRGGNKGIFLNGCLRMTIDGCYTNTQYWSNNAPMPQFGIYAISDIVGNNANHIINSEFRSCLDTGIYSEERKGEGGMIVRDCICEGNRKKAIVIKGHVGAVELTGLHIEAPGNDIDITGCNMVKISGLTMSENIAVMNCRQVDIVNSYIGGLRGDASSYLSLDGVMYAREPDISPQGKIDRIWGNSGQQKAPIKNKQKQNIIAGNLEVWEKGLPIALNQFGDGQIKQDKDARFDSLSARIKSKGETIGLSYRLEKDFHLLADNNKRIILSFWVKSDVPTVAFVGLRYYGNNTDYFDNQYVVATQEWKQYSYIFNLNKKAAYCDCIFGLYSQPNNKEILVDGLQILYDTYYPAAGEDKYDINNIVKRVLEVIKEKISE